MSEFYIETLLEGVIHFKDSLNEYFESQCIQHGTNTTIFYKRINKLLDQLENKIEMDFEFSMGSYDFTRQFYVNELHPQALDYFKKNHPLPLIEDFHIKSADITNRKYRIYLYISDLNEIRSIINVTQE